MTKQQYKDTNGCYAAIPCNENDDVPVATAAAVASTTSVTTPTATATAVAIELNEPNAVGIMSTKYNHNNSAAMIISPLTWRDDFFDDYYNDHEDVNASYGALVAVFDYDYESWESHMKCLGWTCLGISSCCIPSIIPWLLLGCVPCYVNPNITWFTRSHHIALTERGILFIQDARPSPGWGCYMIPQRITFIPYDTISNCTYEIKESHRLSKVVVHAKTISNNNNSSSNNNNNNSKSRHSILPPIVGLEQPLTFQRMVQSFMKGNQNNNNSNNDNTTTTASTTIYDRAETVTDHLVHGNNTTNTTESQQVTSLLREIRDELRRTNNNNPTDHHHQQQEYQEMPSSSNETIIVPSSSSSSSTEMVTTTATVMAQPSAPTEP